MKKIIVLTLIGMVLLSSCTAPQPMASPTLASTDVVENTVTAEPSPTVEPAAVIPLGGSVTRALTSEPTSLDPHGPVGSGQNVIFPFLFDTLVYRQADNTYHPYLAESWTVADDGLSVEYKLKAGITFHDGTPLNAKAVQFTFQRLMDLGAKSPLASGFASVAAVEAPDDQTVRVTFTQPSSIFFSTISTPYAGIISPDAVAVSGENFGQNPVGSGPFKFDSWAPGEAVTLVRNEDYTWGPAVLENQGAAYLDQVVFKIVPDASMQATAFQSGEVDILFINSPSQIARLKEDPAAQMIETTLNSLIYLGFNTQKPPFDKIQVRQAFAYAIDKQELVDVALAGIGAAAFSPLAPTLPGFDASLASLERATDLTKAAELLVEAGYAEQADGSWLGSDGQPLVVELIISTRAPNEAIATVLQEQLKKAGIEITIRALEAAAVSETTTAGDYQAMLWRYDWNDADVLNVYLSTSRIGRTNRSGYSNPQLDGLLEQASHELDQAKRDSLYSQAQVILMDELPWIPLYTPKDFIVMRSSIEGAKIGPMGRMILNEAYLKP